LRGRRLLVALAAVALCRAPLPALSQVDCSTPDNLCTGDPCSIPSLAVGDPCVVDFGTRTVIVAGDLAVPTGGTLSFSAAAVQVQGSISGAAAAIELSTTGAIAIDGPLRRLNYVGPGDFGVDLVAGSDIDINAPLVLMDGNASLTAGGKISVRSQISAQPGGTIGLHAGGDVEITATGRLLIPNNVASGSGGRVFIDAGGWVTSAGRINAYADDLGGEVQIFGPTGVEVSARIDVSTGRFGNGQRLEITSTGGEVIIDAPIRARGGGSGADVTISAASNVEIRRRITADGGRDGGGAPVNITSTSGDVIVDAPISSRGDSFGSSLPRPRVNLAAGNVLRINRTIRVDDLSISSSDAFGATMRLEGAEVQTASRALLSADGGVAGGEIRLVATSGDLVLDGRFQARGGTGAGGIIEGTASADVTTAGTFACAGTPPGCIALTAGGTLDTTGATFDKPLSADCPGSPSGAFLDAVPTLVE